MKVGDLVSYEIVPHEFAEAEVDWGVILKLSRTGHDTLAAQVLFRDGEIAWVSTTSMVVVSEGR